MMQSPESIKITRRLVTYMIERSEEAVASRLGGVGKQYQCPQCGKMTALIDIDVNRERSLAFFQGLGLALMVCFEEMTGNTAKDKKPIDVMQWALELPTVPYPKVGS